MVLIVQAVPVKPLKVKITRSVVPQVTPLSYAVLIGIVLIFLHVLHAVVMGFVLAVLVAVDVSQLELAIKTDLNILNTYLYSKYGNRIYQTR